MSDRTFLDTSVLVYAYDSHEPAKQEIAHSMLGHGVRSDSLVISSQVLGEFFVVVTRKISNPMTDEEAIEAIHALDAIPAVDIDRPMVASAIDIHRRYQISYWDALIVSAAERSGCGSMLIEDLNHDQVYNSVRAVNPFVA